jgi:hypothetical protein
MNKILFASIILSISGIRPFMPACAQDKQEKPCFGMEVNHFYTGSGFASNSEIDLQILSGYRREMGIGLNFSSDFKSVSGFTLHHNIFLLNESMRHRHIVLPYAFYNLIYRKTRKAVPGTLAKNTEAVTGMYTSVEHHLGIGVRVRLLKNLYANAETGYGVYLGSILRPSKPHPVTGAVNGTNGFGLLIKIGVGYVL